MGRSTRDCTEALLQHRERARRVANLQNSAYTTEAPISWEPGTTSPDGSACFVDADCTSGVCDGGVCASESGRSEPCENPITLSPTATGTATSAPRAWSATASTAP